MLNEIFEKLNCCYLDTVIINLENTSKLIVDNAMLSKQNQLFNLINIQDDITEDNLSLYIGQIKELCGNCECFLPKPANEQDSPDLDLEEQWIGSEFCCEKHEEIRVPYSHHCQQISTCENIYEWVDYNLICN